VTERGSEKLQELWGGGGFRLDDELMGRLVEATQEFQISDVYIKGTVNPEVLRASFDVDGDERCGNGIMSILQALQGLGTGRYGRVVVFPKGVPADQFVVNIELGE
jgi:hypothetical protein